MFCSFEFDHLCPVVGWADLESILKSEPSQMIRLNEKIRNSHRCKLAARLALMLFFTISSCMLRGSKTNKQTLNSMQHTSRYTPCLFSVSCLSNSSNSDILNSQRMNGTCETCESLADHVILLQKLDVFVYYETFGQTEKPGFIKAACTINRNFL